MTPRADRFTTKRIFEELNGERFGHFGLLEAAVRQLFVEHLADFPVSYDHWDAMSLAEREGWLVTDAGEVVVRVEKVLA